MELAEKQRSSCMVSRRIAALEANLQAGAGPRNLGRLQLQKTECRRIGRGACFHARRTDCAFDCRNQSRYAGPKADGDPYRAGPDAPASDYTQKE